MAASFQVRHIKSKNFSPFFAKRVSFFYFRQKCSASYSQLLSYPKAYFAREIRRLLLAVIYTEDFNISKNTK
jgi:hypothetical protein